MVTYMVLSNCLSLEQHRWHVIQSPDGTHDSRTFGQRTVDQADGCSVATPWFVFPTMAKI